jgi:hypothetical protein
MRKLIATLLFIFWPRLVLAPAQRAIFFAQNHSASALPATVAGGCATLSPSVSTTVSCTVSGATAGQLLVVEFSFYDNHTITLTDSNTGTVALVTLSSGGYPTIWHGAFEDYVYVIKNIGAGTHVVTATDSASPASQPWIQAVLVNGASTTSPIDSATSIATSSNTIVGGSVTTTSANELMLAFCELKSSSDPISPSNSPQTMTVLQTVAAGFLVGSATAATTGTNYMQCIDTNSYYDDAVIDLMAIH